LDTIGEEYIWTHAEGTHQENLWKVLAKLDGVDVASTLENGRMMKRVVRE
jgi:hypothetical protein